MMYDNDGETFRPVCGAIWASVSLCAPPQSVVLVFVVVLFASPVLFREVWAAERVCQPATKCWASRDAPAAGSPPAAGFPRDAAARVPGVDSTATGCRPQPAANSSVPLVRGCADG